MNALFVYGLLKPGLRLHHIVAPFVELSAPATARGRLYDAGVPAARFDEEGQIEGVVLMLDARRLDEALRVLDDLEDEGTDYRRIVIETRTAGEPIRAFAYEYLLPLDGLAPIGASWPVASR